LTLLKFKFPSVPSTANARVNIPSRMGPLRESPRTVWAIGGGKGGIGKTLITSNMAVYLTWLNKKVIVVDMDLGGANLHTSLGVDNAGGTLSDLLSGKAESLDQLMQPTPIPNLFLVSGAQDPLGIANLPHVQRARLLRRFREANADVVLLDLGAGTANNTLDFFLLADQKIVVVTPEPTSVENAYRFIKSAFYRMLRGSTPSPYVRQLIEQAMETKAQRGIQSPKDLLAEVRRLSPTDGEELSRRMAQFRISLILNQVRTKSEAEIGKSVQMVCERYFAMGVDYLGYLPYDNSVWQSIRKRKPFIVDSPNSLAVTHLEEILRNLMKTQSRTP
jgi:flagellar biosynthesis protein FlhG